MAITFISQPGADEVTGAFLIQSSDNPITYVFSSDNYLQPNFSFIVETIINGDVVSTDVIYPERGGRAHKDVTLSARTYAIKPRRVTTTVVNYANLPTIEVKVYERYGDPRVTYAGVSGRQVKFMKACCPEDIYANNWMPAKYVPNTKWITNVPNNINTLSRKYPVWASMFNALEAPNYRLEFYGETDLDLFVTVVGPTVGTPDRIDMYLSVAQMNIFLFPAGKTMADCYKIKMKIGDSEWLIFEFIGDECIEFHQLSWLNNLGTYDQFLFTHNMDKESSIAVKEYKKQFGTWNIDNEYVYDALESGDTQYQKTIQPSGTIYSGYVSQEYYYWLNTIVESLDTILFQPSEPMMNRISVTDSRTMEPKNRFEDILNFQVSYKKTNFKSVTL